MKKINSLFLSLVLVITCVASLQAQNAWINELHYDNAGTDADEFIEVVIENPGNYNLADFSVVLYNGNNGGAYDTIALNVYTAAATSGNFRFYWYNYTANGGSIQNGAPDGMALVYQGTVIAGQFLSYEGTMTATDGPANGMTSVDIGVAESSTTPAGYSLQLGGTGTTYPAFTWQPEMPSTPGLINTNQSLSGTPDPEPTNYPTSFTATPSAFAITLHWTDATGGQLPAGYLILGSEENFFDEPVDGDPVPDDAYLGDGNGALNISQGTQTCTFQNLPSNMPYYFRIYPYTNAGSNIDYKTDGTVPSTNATTPNAIVIGGANFNDFTFDGWVPHDIIGGQGWVIDSVHGVSGTGCVKMSGYSGAPFENEDWLISPALDFTNYMNQTLSFMSARNYTGPDIEVKISTNYNGTGDPNDYDWTDLTGTLSTGGWAWTSSGDIDISSITGTTVYVGFKYTSTLTDAATWELDNIQVVGEVSIGINDPSGDKVQFSVNPNPVHGSATLEFSNGRSRNITVLSLTGNEVYHTEAAGQKVALDCSQLVPGIYFVRVDQQGSKPEIRKLIVR